MPSIDAKNLTAQMAHRAAGNPPSTLPDACISNCFPGLEFDFRNVWRRLFEGVELHEFAADVVRVAPGGPAALAGVTAQHMLAAVNGAAVVVPTVNSSGDPSTPAALEWSNVLADVVNATAPVTCQFVGGTGVPSVTVALNVRPLFDGAAIARVMANPGELTQSLCSPWQTDYRECACFYWAASRPDFVNAEVGPDGTAGGHSWMQRDRGADTPKQYVSDGNLDDNPDPRLITYEDLYRAWETHLRFVRDGQDRND